MPEEIIGGATPEPILSNTVEDTPAVETAEAEPEHVEAAPDFLYEDPEEPQDAGPVPQYQEPAHYEPQPTYTPAPAPWQNPQQPPQYPQPQPPPVYQDPRSLTVEEFVKNPDYAVNSRIDERVNESINRTVAPIANSIHNAEMNANRAIQAQANMALNSARLEVQRGFNEVLNRDSAFTGNKDVREKVTGWMKNQWNAAVYEAGQGNLHRINMFAKPNFAGSVLALAKVNSGYPSTQTNGVSPGNAYVEGSSNRATDSGGPKIDPNMESALARFGPGYRDRYQAALADAAKHKDVEFWD